MKKENHLVYTLQVIAFLVIIYGMTNAPICSIINHLPEINKMDGVTFTLTDKAINELKSQVNRTYFTKLIIMLCVVALFVIASYISRKDVLGLPAKKIKKNTYFKVIRNVKSVKNKPNLHIVYICDLYDKNDLLVIVYSQTTLKEGSIYKCIGYAENVSLVELAQAD